MAEVASTKVGTKQEKRSGFSLAPLLIHSEAIPAAARQALEAATFGPPTDRTRQLEHAARAIYLETDLNCRDAREIVGLEIGVSCR